MYLRCCFLTSRVHEMFLKYVDKLHSSGKRYFTFQQMMTDLKISPDSAKSSLYRARKTGMIISPAKGLYVIVPPEYRDQGFIPARDLVPILMKYLNLENHYYVALLSAAQYRGASHQKPGVFQIICDKRIKHPLEFGKVKINCIYKKSVVDLDTTGVTVNTGYLKVSSPEVTTMDLFLYGEHSGGLNHTATVLYELIDAIDPKKLITLAIQSQKLYWVQRLGYILQNIEPSNTRKVNLILDHLLNYLKIRSPRFIPLAPELPIDNSPRSKKWMIIENTSIESDL